MNSPELGLLDQLAGLKIGSSLTGTRSLRLHALKWNQIMSSGRFWTKSFPPCFSFASFTFESPNKTQLPARLWGLLLLPKDLITLLYIHQQFLFPLNIQQNCPQTMWTVGYLKMLHGDFFPTNSL